MRYLLLVLALIAPAASAQLTDKMCEQMGELAYQVMKMRQMQMPMSAAMQKMAEVFPEDPNWEKLGREYVKAAYQETGWYGEEKRESAAADFRNQAELSCFNQQ